MQFNEIHPIIVSVLTDLLDRTHYCIFFLDFCICMNVTCQFSCLPQASLPGPVSELFTTSSNSGVCQLPGRSRRTWSWMYETNSWA